MTTKIQKWGNSLGVRLPKDLTLGLKLKEGSEVEVLAYRRTIVLKPTKKKNYSLKDLLTKVTPQNRHSEIDWGKPVGKEIW